MEGCTFVIGGNDDFMEIFPTDLGRDQEDLVLAETIISLVFLLFYLGAVYKPRESLEEMAHFEIHLEFLQASVLDFCKESLYLVEAR